MICVNLLFVCLLIIIIRFEVGKNFSFFSCLFVGVNNLILLMVCIVFHTVIEILFQQKKPDKLFHFRNNYLTVLIGKLNYFSDEQKKLVNPLNPERWNFSFSIHKLLIGKRFGEFFFKENFLFNKISGFLESFLLLDPY